MVSRKTGLIAESAIDIEAEDLCDMLRASEQEKKRATVTGSKPKRDKVEVQRDAAQDVLLRGSAFRSERTVADQRLIPQLEQRRQSALREGPAPLKPRDIFGPVELVRSGPSLYLIVISRRSKARQTTSRTGCRIIPRTRYSCKSGSVPSGWVAPRSPNAQATMHAKPPSLRARRSLALVGRVRSPAGPRSLPALL